MKFNVRRTALTVVMLFLGASLIAGAALSAFPNLIFPLDQYLGTHASVAAAALGVGICVAAFNPAANVTWVRIAILYAGLDVAYQLLMKFWLNAPFSVWPLVLGVVSAALLIALYPQRERLVPATREAATLHTSTDATL